VRIVGTERPGPGDILTLGNAVCGLAAIVYITAHASDDGSISAFTVMRPAVLLLVAGTVLDVLDGAVARRFGATSLGRPLDAMADVVTFGVAPAVLLASLAITRTHGATRYLVAAGAAIYVASALLRLAEFSASRTQTRQFTGLPSTMAAIVVVDVFLLSSNAIVAAAGLAVIGYLMISRLLYPMQGGVLALLAIAGWIFGLVGAVGIVDPHLPAVGSLVFILVIVPASHALRPTELTVLGKP
jgi:CDP-diacylglycerol--serine O-phosphatidyltransferase